MTIRVLIADDQELVRAGFRLILERQDGIEVVGEACDGVEAVQLAAEYSQVEGDEFVTKDARIPLERLAGGAIVLRDAPGWAELKRIDTVETGDHAVVVVEVTDVGLRSDDPSVLTLSKLGLNYGG